MVPKKNDTIFKEFTPTVKWKSLEGISLFCSHSIVGHNPWWHLRFI